VGQVAGVDAHEEGGEDPHHDEAIDEELEHLRVEQGAHHDEEAGEDDEGDIARAAQFVEFDGEQTGGECRSGFAAHDVAILQVNDAEKNDGEDAAEGGAGQRQAVNLDDAAQHHGDNDSDAEPVRELEDVGDEREEERAHRQKEKGERGPRDERRPGRSRKQGGPESHGGYFNGSGRESRWQGEGD